MVADDARGEGLAPALGRELREQALRKVLRADARRVEGLQGGHRLLDGFQGQACLERHVGRRDRKEAAVIQAAHEMLHRGHRLWGKVGHLGLPHQVLLEGGLRRDRVEEVLAALGIGRRVGLGPPGVRHVVAPVVVDLPEDLELL